MLGRRLAWNLDRRSVLYLVSAFGNDGFSRAKAALNGDKSGNTAAKHDQPLLGDTVGDDKYELIAALGNDGLLRRYNDFSTVSLEIH